MADSLASPPNKKKRLMHEAFEPKYTSIANSQLLFEQQKVESLQAQLQHERSLRSFDQQRNQQQQERLSQQVALALDEAASAKKLLDTWRDSHTSIVDSLRESRDALQLQLQDLRIQLDEYQEAEVHHAHAIEQEAHAQAESRLLRHQLDTAQANEREIQKHLEQLQQTVDAQIARQSETSAQALSSPVLDKLMEEAPPAVMKELHRVRFQLAETERRERQLTRRVEQTERRNKALIQEREQALQQCQRLPSVEKALQQMQEQHERLQAENATFKDFAKRLATQLRALNIFVQSSDGPPEVSTLMRFLETAQKKIDKAEQLSKEYAEKCSSLETTVQMQEVSLKRGEVKERRWAVEREELTQKFESTQRHVETLREQHSIYIREADSLRALIKTFDELPFVPRSSAAASSLSGEASAQSLQVSLSSTRQELELFQKDRDRLSQELDTASKAKKELSDELERVREKFFKLRDALQAERTKVENSEARAIQAESLSGKGSFDPESTRVLHLKETPLTHALKEEVNVLKRQLELLKGAEKSSASKLNAPDPDKLNQRLKQNFKEQIAVFREGVYLMTGYKVDMLPGTDRPTFRVRSMYAEREEDHLMLKWPKTAEQVTSLDVLNTDLAKLLSTTPNYEYMTKFHSLPAFLSSVQLSLFEKQTVLM